MRPLAIVVGLIFLAKGYANAAESMTDPAKAHLVLVKKSEAQCYNDASR
jgi:hypothetical protein